MIKMKTLFILLALILAQFAYANQVYNMYANDGTFLGNTGSQFDPNSINNQFGKYGSQFSPNSIHNQFGQYGSPFSPTSPSNQFAQPPVFTPQNQNFGGYRRY